VWLGSKALLGGASYGVKRILLVEDEEDIAEILGLVLESAGYAVDTAGTVAQARQLLEQSTYTLVNTDLRLPDGHGLEIADRAADLGVRTSILSGYVFQLPAGAAVRHEVMMKPMRPSEFVAAVHRLIGPAGDAWVAEPLIEALGRSGG
jgi:DNA-binding response OmpR family regulator